MERLIDIARILRSKNAGPLYVTFDLMFSDLATMKRVLNSTKLTQEIIAERYNVMAKEVIITPYDIVNSIKITIPRTVVSGDVEDTDVYGCQQHIALANLEIE